MQIEKSVKVEISIGQQSTKEYFDLGVVKPGDRFCEMLSFFINVSASGSSNSSSSSNGMVGGATMNTYYDFIYIILFLGLAFFFKKVEGIAIWAVFVLLYVYYNRKKR